MNDKTHFRGLPRAFWVLLFGYFVNRAGGFIAPFLTLSVTNERHIPLERAGLIVSMVGFGGLGAGPVGGVLADRLGRRPALVIATTCGAGAMFALGLTRAPEALAIGALTVGFFGEMFRPAAMAIVADIVPPEEQARAFGLIYWAANLGFAIAPMVAGFVAAKSYALLFLGDGLTTLAFGAIVVANVPETRPTRREAHLRLTDMLTPYRNGPFFRFAFCSFLIGVMFHQIGTTLPLDLQAHGIPATTYGALLSINGILITLLQPFTSLYTRRASRRWVLTVSAAVVGVGFGINAVAAGAVPVYAFSIVVWTMGEIGMAGLSPTIVADLAPAHLRGSFQGAFQLAFGAAAGLAPLVGTWTLVHFGSAVFWQGCVLCGLLAAAGYAAVVPERNAAVAPSPE